MKRSDCQVRGRHEIVMRGLSTAELADLQARIEHEVVLALREREPVGELLSLVAAVERRRERASEREDAVPTLARRQRIAGERGAVRS